MIGSRAAPIYLARHGKSELNEQQRISGQLDTPLSARGLAQSRALAAVLAAQPLTAVYTSTLQRSIDTAQPTARIKGLDIATRAGFNEIHHGILQGRYRDERDPEAAELWQAWRQDMWNQVVPEGETLREFTQRVRATLAEVLRAHSADEPLLIVSHRGTNRVLLGSLLGIPESDWPGIRVRSKFLYRVSAGAVPRLHTITIVGSTQGRVHDGLLM